MSTPAASSGNAADLLAWITLSRVAEGSVTKQGDHYLDGGAPGRHRLSPCVPRLTGDFRGLPGVPFASPGGQRMDAYVRSHFR
jgi:hypothetical protein